MFKEKSILAKFVLLFLLFTIFLIASPLIAPAREAVKARSGNAEAQKHIDEAWKALDEEMKAPELELAINHLKRAAELDPKNPDILVELSQELFMRGFQEAAGKPARKENFQKGMEAAKKALALKESAGAHYWYAANLGALNEDASVLAQTSVFSELAEHVDWVIQHEKNYHFGVAARFWIGVIVNAPPMVMRLVGRDQGEIYADLEEAIKKEPRFFENHLLKAEYLHYLGKNNEAFSVLDKMLKSDPTALVDQKAMNRFTQRRGRRLWVEWTGKNWPNR